MANPTDQAHHDRLELAQYRAIFAKLDELLDRAGELHVVKSPAGTRRIRVIEYDRAGNETIESVYGSTLRDAMAQAAQVVS
jgi:hypothetical protein